MTEASIQIRSCQGLALIQDYGRPAARQHACPIGGAADIYGFRCAQALAGNPANTPAIELTLGRLELEYSGTQALTLAFAGDAHECAINGEAQPSWSTLTLRAGDCLSLLSNHRGLRSYLAFAAEWHDLDIWMDSAATLLAVKRGGHQGRSLEAGDELILTSPRSGHARSLPWSAIPKSSCRIAVLPGPQATNFCKTDIRHFYRQPWRISAKSDRRGIRLEGPPLSGPITAQLISEPVVPGAVQILPDGQPLILMQDGPTTGGYPKIGQLTQPALARLAQKVPGDIIRCEKQDIQSARQQWQDWQQQLDSLPSLLIERGLTRD